MSRSIKKGPFVDARLLGRIDDMNKRSERKVLKTWSRASVIFPQMVGHTIAVHDGRRHVPIYITEDRVQHGLDAVAPTRPLRSHMAAEEAAHYECVQSLIRRNISVHSRCLLRRSAWWWIWSVARTRMKLSKCCALSPRQLHCRCASCWLLP